MKVCSRCKEEKSLLEFGIDKKTKDGRNCYCKECAKIRGREYRVKNLDKVTASKQKWKDNNPDYTKSYYDQNKEFVKSQARKYRANNLEICREREKVKYVKDKPRRRKYLKKKYDNDPMHRLKVNVRSRLAHYIKKDGITTIDLIGCSYDQLKKHLESQFKPGMTWDNHGQNGWHVDHIFPLAKAKDKEHLYSLCHYTNLQPLWWIDNLRKGDKLPEEMYSEITG
jgi:hypothetical protein